MTINGQNSWYWYTGDTASNGNNHWNLRDIPSRCLWSRFIVHRNPCEVDSICAIEFGGFCVLKMVIFIHLSHKLVGCMLVIFHLVCSPLKESSPGSISEEDLAHSRCAASEEDGRFADAWVCLRCLFFFSKIECTGYLLVNLHSHGKSPIYPFLLGKFTTNFQ